MTKLLKVNGKYRKPTAYRGLFETTPQHSKDSMSNLRRRKVANQTVDFYSLRILIDLLTFSNVGTRRRKELYELTSEDVYAFLRERIRVMNEKSPGNERYNIRIFRTDVKHLHRLMHTIYMDNKDYQVNGVYVYRKRVPTRFAFNAIARASWNIGYMSEETYYQILNFFLEREEYLQALTLSLLYKSGMDEKEITQLKSDIIYRERNEDGTITTHEVEDMNKNISTYSIGMETLEIMEKWLEHRGVFHKKVMATYDGVRTEELTENWMTVFWKFDVQKNFDIDYSHHYLLHDDNRTVVNWKSKAFRV